MMLSALTGLIAALLQFAVLYLIGRILCKPAELRKFLGMELKEENTADFHNISKWIETIGGFVKLIAIFSGLSSFITTILIIMN
jgi:membrane protein DedA with SNARE-associated domain